MSQTGRLQDRIVVVTGATSGIGRAIAERCVHEGAIAIANGRSDRALKDLAAAHHGRLVAYPADLIEDGSCEGVVAQAELLGAPFGLVHAAGTVRRGEDPRASDASEFLDFIALNLATAFTLTAQCCARFPTAATAGRSSCSEARWHTSESLATRPIRQPKEGSRRWRGRSLQRPGQPASA
jgi:NAD(P)-dependent dehydrogenase (short-subunit alcohol dehydrogenase family)